MPIPYNRHLVMDRPGYFGKRRGEKINEYDNRYGRDRWEECWQFGGWILSFHEAVILYDEAYYQHLHARWSDLTFVRWLLEFTDCYDSDPSNVYTGVHHDALAVPRHIQDVSVRRALIRLGAWFSRNNGRLLQIRGEGTEGHCLMPGNVPFHRPDLVPNANLGQPLRDWMETGSVEWAWQLAKIIIRKT